MPDSRPPLDGGPIREASKIDSSKRDSWDAASRNCRRSLLRRHCRHSAHRTNGRDYLRAHLTSKSASSILATSLFLYSPARTYVLSRGDQFERRKAEVTSVKTYWSLGLLNLCTCPKGCQAQSPVLRAAPVVSGAALCIKPQASLCARVVLHKGVVS